MQEDQPEYKKLLIINNFENNNIKYEQILPKELKEKFCCCCVDYNITQNEFNSYSKLKMETNIPYDENNSEHEKTLSSFYDSSKNIYKDLIEFDSIKEEEKWKIFGFQSTNPRTDFRGAGIYSLKFMNYFVNHFEEDAKFLFNQTYFLFAVVCIRLTFLLRLNLYLFPKNEIKVQQLTNKIKGCSRKELKNFCRSLEKDEYIFLDILSYCLIFIKTKFFRDIKNEQKEKNFLLIDPILNFSILVVNITLNENNNRENLIDELKNNLNKNLNIKIN